MDIQEFLAIQQQKLTGQQPPLLYNPVTKSFSSANPDSESMKTAASGAGVGQGLTMGWGDELSGLGGAAVNKIKQLMHMSGASNETVQAAYQRIRDEQRASNTGLQNANPFRYGVGQLVGAALPVIASGGGSLPVIMGKGAALGATTGAGNANNVSDIPQEAAIQGGIGAALPGVAGAVGKVAPIVGNLVKKVVDNYGDAKTVGGAAIGGALFGNTVVGGVVGNALKNEIKNVSVPTAQNIAQQDHTNKLLVFDDPEVYGPALRLMSKASDVWDKGQNIVGNVAKSTGAVIGAAADKAASSLQTSNPAISDWIRQTLGDGTPAAQQALPEPVKIDKSAANVIEDENGKYITTDSGQKIKID
jgi:hypothetical protein